MSTSNINDNIRESFSEVLGVKWQNVILIRGDSWREPVSSLATLPSTWNTVGEVRQTLDTYTFYTWNGSSWSPSAWGGWGTPATTVVSSTTYNQASAVGFGTSYARNDHTHGTPALPTKADVGLWNVDNTSDVNKPVSTATQTAINNASVGLLDDRGNYNASVNTYPASGGSGSAGAVLKGDLWTVSVGGTLGGVAVTAGDVVRSLIDTPAQVASNWAISENNIGYVAENQANKDSTTTLWVSNTLYPTQNAVKVYVDTVLTAKEGTITGTTSVDFWSGAKTFINFATTVRATVLTGLSLISTTVISATDTVLVAFGSLQAQITALTTTVGTKANTARLINTTAPLAGGGDLSADRTLTTSMNTARLIGRWTAGIGVMEEITLGTNLSLTGNTLNSAGGGVVAPVTARIRRSTNQSIATGSTFIDLSFDTSAYQVNGTFWTTGATVTIPETGYYQVFVEGTFDGAAAAVTCDMQVLLNGATVVGDDQQMVAASATTPLQVMAQRLFTTGDTIKVQVKHSSVTALNMLTQGDHSPDIILTKLTGAKGDVWSAGGAITQTIIPIAVNTTGWAAANTNYIYTTTAGLVFTLPTAVGNTNLYTLKARVAGVSFATTASQTVDGVTTGTLVLDQALTVYSDNANWNII